MIIEWLRSHDRSPPRLPAPSSQSAQLLPPSPARGDGIHVRTSTFTSFEVTRILACCPGIITAIRFDKPRENMAARTSHRQPFQQDRQDSCQSQSLISLPHTQNDVLVLMPRPPSRPLACFTLHATHMLRQILPSFSSFALFRLVDSCCGQFIHTSSSTNTKLRLTARRAYQP